MTSRAQVLGIAALSTAAICAQNLMAVVAFGWGLIHGAGLGAMLAFLPAAIGIGLVWGGAAVAAGWTPGRGAAVLFGAYALGILALNEMILPGTPLQDWRTGRALEAIDVRNIRDEPLLSREGNPIGVRLSYEVLFPRAVVGNVSGSLGVPHVAGEFVPLGLYLGRHGEAIDPEPDRKGAGYAFLSGIVYTISETKRPMFLSTQPRTDETCLNANSIANVSRADFLALLANRRNVSFTGGIQASSEHATHSVWLVQFVSSRGYDMEAMYQTAMTEGYSPCEGPY